jgi:hypothetical protein
VKRKRLISAVRERMRTQASARAAEDAVAIPSPASPARARRGSVPDPELEQLQAEARYHRNRFELYRARVISGSRTPTSATRLRELEGTATAAADRLAHARAKREQGSR